MTDSNYREEYYKAETKNVENLAGFAASPSHQGKVSIIERGFLTSFDQKQSKIMAGAVRLLVGQERDINDLLVVIRHGVAQIYRKFPLVLRVRMKTDVKQFHAVFKNQILDIEGVDFRDDFFSLDIKDGDKFLWLFRNGFNFGLYFDFSGKLKSDGLSSLLGRCYRQLEYYATCSYFQVSDNAKFLFDKGWFPFIHLIGEDLERLISTSQEDFSIVEEHLINGFSKDRIDGLTGQWWSNSIFSSKRNLIGAGISAFFANTSDGNINCIKSLIPEIEGVIRLSFHRENGKSPSTAELKIFLAGKAKQRFSSEDSFGFPGLFADYLNEVIFKGFDIEKDIVELSRHSVGHGVATEEMFTRARALQCVLTLDQIYFYLGKTDLEEAKTQDNG